VFWCERGDGINQITTVIPQKQGQCRNMTSEGKKRTKKWMSVRCAMLGSYRARQILKTKSDQSYNMGSAWIRYEGGGWRWESNRKTVNDLALGGSIGYVWLRVLYEPYDFQLAGMNPCASMCTRIHDRDIFDQLSTIWGNSLFSLLSFGARLNSWMLRTVNIF